MSNRIAIVTDSTADLTPAEVADYGISVVPLTIHLAGKSYPDDGRHTSEFYALLSQTTDRPTTSSPTLTAFREMYDRAADDADAIISIHISGKLSDTVRRARQAAETMLGRSRVHVLDSEVTSVGLGILAKQAALMARQGRDADSIIRTLRGMIDHIYVVFFVESLDFLEHGGRIGKAQALLGTMLNIKPMLILEEGEIEPLEKVRTRLKAIEKLADFVSEFGHIESLTVLHNQTEGDEVHTLIERIEAARDSNMRISVARYGPVLAAHIGPDALGLVVYEGIRDNPWD